MFAGCLDPTGYGATQLSETSSSRLHVVSLDVTSDESVKDAVEYVKRHLPGKGEFDLFYKSDRLFYGL